MTVVSRYFAYFYHNLTRFYMTEIKQLVSIIVPVYQIERYVIDCIESLINQTYQNIEIILVDDGSNDSSGIYCDHYARTDHRIKVIHQENKGLSAARNTGVRVAHGDILLFVDGDDYVSRL